MFQDPNMLDNLFNNLTTEDLLNFDGLAEAEKITGRSYKVCEETSSLGSMFIMVAGEKKRNLLKELGDTNSRSTLLEFENLLQLEGFEKIYSKEYIKKDYEYTFGNDQMQLVDEISHLNCYWHPELYVLISCTTYPNFDIINDEVVSSSETINSGKMYYCLNVKKHYENDNKVWESHSSGGYNKDGSYSGDHDIREGFRFNLNNLKKYHDFVKWSKEPFLWLIHYSETKEDYYNSDELNKNVLEQFPINIQNIIKGDKDV